MMRVYDIVWMQDALLHSNNKPKVFEEVARVLKPRGRFIFTDPMQSDDCPDGVLQPVLNRIHLQEMGSVIRYRHLASKVGLETCNDKNKCQNNWYFITARFLNTLKAKFDQIRNQANEAYLNNMMIGLQHWIDAGQKGYLNWAILQFQKKKCMNNRNNKYFDIHAPVFYPSATIIILFYWAYPGNRQTNGNGICQYSIGNNFKFWVALCYCSKYLSSSRNLFFL